MFQVSFIKCFEGVTKKFGVAWQLLQLPELKEGLISVNLIRYIKFSRFGLVVHVW